MRQTMVSSRSTLKLQALKEVRVTQRVTQRCTSYTVTPRTAQLRTCYPWRISISDPTVATQSPTTFSPSPRSTGTSTTLPRSSLLDLPSSSLLKRRQ